MPRANASGLSGSTKTAFSALRISRIEGKSEAINNGVKHAKNEFIITIDADSSIKKDFIKKIIRPFSDKTVAATTGIIKVLNDNKILASFQAVEYNLHNIIRNSFSKIFKNSVWFLGALACYRKSVLEKIKFKKESLIEDMFLAMEIKKNGYKTLSVADAYGYTVVPEKIKDLYHERVRWWVGGFQAIFKNKDMFKLKYGASIIFLFINQVYWSIYAILSLPIIIYQVLYWLPYNLETITQTIIYFVRWFSLWGPVYVLYNLPKNGISFFTFFGVISGILSLIIILIGMFIFKEKLNFKKILAIFFYFPYTIVLNIIILISLIKIRSLKKRYFIK